MKKYINPLLTAGSLIALLYTVYEQNVKITSLKTELTISSLAVDSLHDESFNAKSEAGRYELSLEHLKETNPKAAKDFEDYMEHETE
jgi:hypothetical protein